MHKIFGGGNQTIAAIPHDMAIAGEIPEGGKHLVCSPTERAFPDVERGMNCDVGTHTLSERVRLGIGPDTISVVQFGQGQFIKKTTYCFSLTRSHSALSARKAEVHD